MKKIALLLIGFAFVLGVSAQNKSTSNTAINHILKFECDSGTTTVPNVFTPNQDGYNDGFNVKSDCIQSIEKKVYNRWGELVFHSIQLNEEWDGRTTAGIEVPEGTYFYIIDAVFTKEGSEVSETFTGTVTLLR